MAKTYKVSELAALSTDDLIAMLAKSRVTHAQAWIHAKSGPSPTGTGRPATDGDADAATTVMLDQQGVPSAETILLVLAAKGVRT